MTHEHDHRESNRDMLASLGLACTFKHLTHLGKLRAKLDSGELAEASIPAILGLGQNGGAKTRKERRRGLEKLPVAAVAA